MGLQLRCFITHPRAATSHLTGYAEHLSRFSVGVRCADVSNPASLLPAAGDDIRIYVELPAQRVSAVRRCLYCIATVIGTSATADGGRLIDASIEDMQFKDLPVRFDQKLRAETAPWRMRTM